ncbi:UNVERIFIED_CONTAM: Uclacyanin 1 [Sesamum angustifolium]|uniref:Uclacyanin 1 n=1 Tax=Sesamum angustifolium TaxID=2727405 RepID=A0AAW2NKZ4_9LAMI
MEVSTRFVPLLVLILTATLSREALAAKHAVGGSQGWDESVDFDSWASAQTFKVGDELEFKYTAGLHSVVELAGESAYKSCDIGSALNSLNGGSNTVKLSKPGPRYFACGTPGHCEQGMKVKITTAAADGSSSTTTPPSGCLLLPPHPPIFSFSVSSHWSPLCWCPSRFSSRE